MPELDFITTAAANPNVKAFLFTIRQSEGTSAPDGYTYLFGSSPNNDIRFTGFDAHPDIKRPYGNTYSDAAGAYQIMFATYTALCNRLGFTDFTPATQDLMAIELISEKDCLQRLMDGDFNYALQQCNTVWASLPGSPYGQPVHSIDVVTNWYKDNGGSIA